MRDPRFPDRAVREAAAVAWDTIGFVEAAIEGIIGASIPTAERSPLRVLAVTQRLQMATSEMRDALSNLLPDTIGAVTGLDDA